MKKRYHVYSYNPDNYGSAHVFDHDSAHDNLRDAVIKADSVQPAFVKRFDFDGLGPTIVYMTDKDEVEFYAGPYDLR